MTREQTQTLRDYLQRQPGAMSSDDLTSLARYLNVASLDYIDVGLVQAREQALASWPLLAEVVAWQEKQQ